MENVCKVPSDNILGRFELRHMTRQHTDYIKTVLNEGDIYLGRKTLNAIDFLNQDGFNIEFSKHFML